MQAKLISHTMAFVCQLTFSLLFVACLLSLDVAASGSTNVEHNVKSETYKIGNTKVKNYNIHHNNFQPAQMTQVLVVPKMDKKMRKTRSPTNEEFAVKRRILEIFTAAKQGLPGQMDHLGLILEALNPKYISTERVLQTTFGDRSGFFAYLAGIGALQVSPEQVQQLQSMPTVINHQPNAIVMAATANNLQANHHQQQHQPQFHRSRSMPTSNRLVVPRFKDQHVHQQFQMQPSGR